MSAEFPHPESPIFGQQINVDPGIRVSMIGENNQTLNQTFRYLAGESLCSPGTKWLDGEDISLYGYIKIMRRGMSVGSARLRIFQSLTMEEHFRIRLAALNDETSCESWIGWAKEQFSVLRSVPSTECGNFSGGEQQTLMLALTLIGWPRLVILEEPWMGLSPAALQDVLKVFQILEKKGTSILLIYQQAATNPGSAMSFRLNEVSRLTKRPR